MRLVLAVLCLALAAQSALACACCVEKGERFESVEDIGAYAYEEFAALTSDGRAVTFVTACDLDCVRGLRNPQYEYAGEIGVVDGVFRMQFPGAGTLSMPLSKTFIRFGVDPDPFSPGPSPTLFSEFRFRGQLMASSDFAQADGKPADLVFTGETNWCWSAGDFSHWALDVSTPAAEFRLFERFHRERDGVK